MGERRGLNPRMVESQSTALPLGYAHHVKSIYLLLLYHIFYRFRYIEIFFYFFLNFTFFIF